MIALGKKISEFDTYSIGHIKMSITSFCYWESLIELIEIKEYESIDRNERGKIGESDSIKRNYKGWQY